MEGVSSFTRAALGSIAHLGDLYDAHRDAFLQTNIFKERPSAVAVHLSDNPSTHLKVLNVDTVSSKLEKLNANSNLKLGILSGHIQVEGYGEYLNNHRTSSRAVKVSLLYDVNTKHERLDIAMIAVEDCISLDSISSISGATHVVVGINWGANLMIEADHINEDNLGRKELEENIKTQMEKLAFVIKGTQGMLEGEWENNDLTADKNFSCKIFGDVLTQRTPVTIGKVYELLTDVPNIIAETNDGKGVPISYVMLPLNSLNYALRSKIRVDNYVKRIQDSTVLEISNVFDELISTKQEVHDFYSDIDKNRFCIGDEDLGLICDLKNKLDDRLNLFRSTLTKVLTEISSGEKGEIELNKLIADYDNSSKSASEIRKQFLKLNHVTAKIEMVNVLQRQYEIQYIGRNSSVDDLILENKKGNVYILYFDEQRKKAEFDVWQKTKLFFLDLADKSKSNTVDPSTPQLNTFCFVDCDLSKCKTMQEGIKISHYSDGQLVTSDLLTDTRKKSQKCYARSFKITPNLQGKSHNRTNVLLPCPGSIDDGPCNKEEHFWMCSKCENPLQFCYDQNFYCLCGYAPFISFQFKCNDVNHATSFTSFKKVALMEEILYKMKPVKKLNILLLGETGVGKSTWINSFANYITYPSIGEALENDLISPVPAKFSIHYNEEQKTICTGYEDNESYVQGQSATQFPVSHHFYTNELTIQLIDTPGIGDTRGVQKDKENIKNIFNHLSYVPDLHAICILLKPNESRLNMFLKYCIKELLIHLHKDAAKNIIFCFTNARATFYKPGETLGVLRKLLHEIPEANIVLSTNTYYCFDNEAFRFLAALKQGVAFSVLEQDSFSTSWNISVKETDRMIKHILLLPPHVVEDTLSINDARRTILELTKPLAEIARNIQTNISLLSDTVQEITSHKGTKEELQKKLIIPIIDLLPKPLGYPRTVCTRCVDYMTVGAIKKANYKTICHDKCQLTVDLDTVRCAELQRCWALYETKGRKCRICGCPWEVHMHITYELNQVDSTAEDRNVKKQIEEKDKEIKSRETTIHEIERRKRTYEGEERVILEVCSTFAVFLKANAIAPYNDDLYYILEYLIEEEKAKEQYGGKKDILNRLVEVQRRYLEEKRIIEDSTTNAGEIVEAITPQKVKELEQKLYALPISGPMLKNIMIVASLARRSKIHCRHKTFIPSQMHGHKSEKNVFQKTIASVKTGLKETKQRFKKIKLGDE